MLLLHCADLHLGRRPQGGRGDYSETRYDDYFRAFAAIVDLALARQVACLTIGGDFFDSNAMLPATLARAESQLQRLHAAGIPVVATHGNHDRPGYGGDSEFWLAYLEEKGLLRMPRVSRQEGPDEPGWNFVPVVIEEMRFWATGWWMAQNAAVLADLAAKLSPADRDRNVVLAHTAVQRGGDDAFDFGTVPPEAVAPLADRVVFAGGGHLHGFSAWPEEKPFFFVPGAPEYFDIAERAADKAVVLFETTTSAWERVALAPRRKHDCRVTPVSADTAGFLADELPRLVKERGIAVGDLVRLDIACPVRSWIDGARVETWLEDEAGVLKAAVRVLTTGSGPAGTETGREAPPLASLIRDCIAGQEFFRGHPDLTAALLDGLREAHLASGGQAAFLERARERLGTFFAATATAPVAGGKT